MVCSDYWLVKKSKCDKVKLIEIILEINRDGSVTSEEIQEIIDSNNVNLDAYILAQIKTTGIYYNASDGSVGSVPWRYSFPLFNFHNAKGIFVDYTPECIDKLYGWTLQVDGNSLGENDGYILGFTGFINNYINLIPEFQYSTFKLDGFGILILHEKNIWYQNDAFVVIFFYNFMSTEVNV